MAEGSTISDARENSPWLPAEDSCGTRQSLVAAREKTGTLRASNAASQAESADAASAPLEIHRIT